ncbi:hypothetical protein AF331_17935 [Rossellomorea marisflavi]|uniref:Tyr recombinase domain-containing protein n=2 Tax=Rossellomorea marisflavi TaxID=189381 RepID=A0A0M0G0N3_9BACI|nr:hypothetical protein AF331_17935 [Rossellomorea marisflavi]
MYKFEISTGLRLEEILALSWSDIDFNNQTIIVKNIVDAGVGGEQNIVEIRSDYRKVMIPSQLLPELKKHKEEQQLMKEEKGDQYDDKLNLVFPKKEGGLQRPSTVRARFNRLVDKANIRRINFHDLRKTHATLLVKSGVSLDVVMNLLGYKSIETIINFLGPEYLDLKITLHPYANNEKDND